MSLVDAEGEWTTRKINIFGVLRSFISQLKPGQDLTRVSLPAVLLHPFSLLEVIGSRELTTFDLLVELNRQNDPLERFLYVLRWVFSCLQQETFHKKPYNPVLGETQSCHIESKENGPTECIAEQVSHHPPVSAFVVRNKQQQIWLNGNISFSVKFGTNSVSIVTEGPAVIHAERYGEEYEMSKSLPDMKIARIVWGVKKIFWTGEVTIVCPKTGYSASVSFEESNNENIVKGSVTRFNGYAEETLFNIDGRLSHSIYMSPADRPGERRLLIDVATVRRPNIIYPPKNDLPPLASLNVWADVSRHIVDNDMDRADEAKKLVENEQRQRIAERKAAGLPEANPTYFAKSEGAGWTFKGTKDDKPSSATKRRQRSPLGSANGSRRSKFDLSDSSDSDSDFDSSDAEPPAPPKKDVRASAPARTPMREPSSPTLSSMRSSLQMEKHRDDHPRKEDKEPLHARKDSARAEPRRDDLDERRSSEEKRLSGGAQMLHSASMESKEEPREKRSRRSQSSSTPIASSPSPAPIHHPAPAVTVPSPAPAIVVTPARRDASSRDSMNFRGSAGATQTPASPAHAVSFPPQANYVREEMLDKNEQKKLRAEVKKALGKPINTTVVDDNVEIRAGYMKMRNSMKLWVRKFFVLRPGKLVYYDNQSTKYAKSRCAGILRLSDCKLKLRQSGKDGYVFKIYHLLHYPIYHRKGLQGETLKLAMIPVSWNYCLLKVSSEEERTQWINAINQQIAFANYTDSPTRRLQLPADVAHVANEPLLSSASEDEDEGFEEEKEEPDEHEHEHEAEEHPKLKLGLHESDPKSDDEEHEVAPIGPPPLSVGTIGVSPIGVGTIDPKTNAAVAAELDTKLEKMGGELAEDLFQDQGHDDHPADKLLKEYADEQRSVLKAMHKKTMKAMDEHRRTLEARLLATERKLLTVSSRAATPPSKSKGISFSYLQFGLVVLFVFLLTRYWYST